MVATITSICLFGGGVGVGACVAGLERQSGDLSDLWKHFCGVDAGTDPGVVALVA